MSLTIGMTAVKVRGIQEIEPELIGGGYGRAHNGTLIDYNRAVKLRFRVQTAWLNDTDFTALRAVLDTRTAQTISGTFVPFTSGRTKVNSTSYISDYTQTSNTRRSMSFELTEE